MNSEVSHPPELTSVSSLEKNLPDLFIPCVHVNTYAYIH